MNQDALHDLLRDGVPNPPSELMTPPMAGIRRRAHRRRLVTGVSAAAALLIVAVLGVQFVAAVRPGRPSVPQGRPSAAGPWIFAVVSADDRTVTLVREAATAGGYCPGSSAAGVVPLPGPVGQHADRVELPVPALAPQANCMYQMPVHLDAPLGDRAVISGADNTRLLVLPARILPRPTYPAGIGPDNVGNIVGNAPRPAWEVRYRSPDGLIIDIQAIPADTAPTLPPGERVRAHGHDMQIQFLTGGKYKTSVVSWTDRGWLVAVDVAGTDHGDVTRTELQRVIDGLVWP